MILRKNVISILLLLVLSSCNLLEPTPDKFEECEVVGQIEKSTKAYVSPTTNGKTEIVVGQSPARTEYLCPDGIIYTH